MTKQSKCVAIETCDGAQDERCHRKGHELCHLRLRPAPFTTLELACEFLCDSPRRWSTGCVGNFLSDDRTNADGDVLGRGGRLQPWKSSALPKYP